MIETRACLSVNGCSKIGSDRLLSGLGGAFRKDTRTASSQKPPRSAQPQPIDMADLDAATAHFRDKVIGRAFVEEDHLHARDSSAEPRYSAPERSRGRHYGRE